jgi:hypothetical protein
MRGLSQLEMDRAGEKKRAKLLKPLQTTSMLAIIGTGLQDLNGRANESSQL